MVRPGEPLSVREREDDLASKPVKLYGRVIDSKGARCASNIQVVIRAAGRGQEDWTVATPLLVAYTNSGGYFAGEALLGPYVKAAAFVAGVPEVVPIALQQGNIPVPLLLFVDIPELKDAKGSPTKKSDCTCTTNNSVPRTPDQWDLANAADVYSTDLGSGRCVQFNVPNRAIEEFDFYTVVRTTEPDIRGVTLTDRQPGGVRADLFDTKIDKEKGANAEDGRGLSINSLLKLAHDPNGARHFEALKNAIGKRPPGRSHLNGANPVDWDSTPTFYEATTIAHGHLLHYKQVWHADGYSLGDLLYSLPLAPGQKKVIAVVDWERREQASRREDTFFNEALYASLNRDRDLSEVISGTLSESMNGGSKANTWGIGAGTGGAASGSWFGFNFGALHGLSGGYGESNSDAWMEASREVGSSSLQRLRDSTLQSASSVRGLRSSVVHLAGQGETARASTEVVANHNHCHAITVQYFEVLRHLKVTHELVGVQECLFIPLPMHQFNRQMVLRWRPTLETYVRRRELLGSFDALRRVETKWNEVKYPTDAYADELITSLQGEIHLTFYIPLPPMEIPQGPNIDPARVVEAIAPTQGFLGALLAGLTGGMSIVASEAAKNIAHDATVIAEALSKEPTAQQRYDKFHRDVMPGIAADFVDGLELWAVYYNATIFLADMDFTLVSDYQAGNPLLVSVRGRLTTPFARRDLTHLIIKSKKGLPTGCRLIVNDAMFTYRTSSFEHVLAHQQKVNDDIKLPTVIVAGLATGPLLGAGIGTTSLAGDGATINTPMDSWEQLNPRKEDERLSNELVEHLNSNLEYYHHAIWWTMDPNRRFMLLDGYFAPGSQKRSVASVVENRLIGIAGNSLIMPVAPGIHLDPGLQPDRFGNVDLKRAYAPSTPAEPARVSLPTRGVFAEAVMGSCNACEHIDNSRYWNWPMDEVPAVEPPTTASRRSEPSNVQPGSFPTPIVSIQNASPAPDPAGVRAATEALGRQAFPDITGLAGSQAGAQAAYRHALDTALAFGKEASDLAQQAAMLGGLDKTMQAIDQAEADGKIGQDDAKRLRLSALEKAVGNSGGTLAPESANERRKVIDEAATQGSITLDDARTLNRAVLAGLVGREVPAQDDRAAASKKIDQMDPGSVHSIETTDRQGGSTRIVMASSSEGQPGTIRSEGVGETYRWADLISFEPSQSLLTLMQQRGLEWQPIDQGYGDVNLDFFAIEILRLPNDPASGVPFSAHGLIDYIRKNFSTLVIRYPGLPGPSFDAYDPADQDRWVSDNPLGAVMKFRIDARPFAEKIPFDFPLSGAPIPEFGLVMCAEFVTNDQLGDWHWNFTTLRGNGIVGYHPVSGTRQFGLRKTGNTVIFFIRAADRVTTIAEYAASPLVFRGADAYWMGFFSNISSFVKMNGGESAMGPIYSHRHPWTLVRQYVRGNSSATL
jgi:hypothetical protein